METATQKTESFNTIIALTYHIHYFVKIQLKVLEQGLLEGKDNESYEHPNITSQSEWETLYKAMWNNAERFTKLLAELPDATLAKPFTNEKYGTYASNIQGLIEHTYYHLGQIVILKKCVSKI